MHRESLNFFSLKNANSPILSKMGKINHILLNRIKKKDLNRMNY